PSKWAGMGRRKSVSGEGGVGPAIAKPFARSGDGALAIMPHAGHFWCGCDVPYPGTHAHLAGLARARYPERAIQRAIQGAVHYGTALNVNCDRALMAGTLLLGDQQELAEVGFLPALAALAPAGISLAKSLFHKKHHGKAPSGSEQHPDGSVSVPVDRQG